MSKNNRTFRVLVTLDIDSSILTSRDMDIRAESSIDAVLEALSRVTAEFGPDWMNHLKIRVMGAA